MKSSVRPQRGGGRFVNKVTKPGAPTRVGRTARTHDVQQLLHHQSQHEQHEGKRENEEATASFDGISENYTAAAAAAAAAAIGNHGALTSRQGHGHGHEVEDGTDADMDDDTTSSAQALAQHLETPHLDMTAATILANVGVHHMQDDPNQQQQAELQQQQQAQHHHQAQIGEIQHASMDPALVGSGSAKTTEELAHESGYSELNIESALAKRLAREQGHRHAQQRRPEQVLNLARRSNVEALFAHIAGEPARVPCKNCHKGHGPWTTCIVVDGQMCGSCANCWFNASGARCSFHETRHQTVPQMAGLVTPSAVGLAGASSFHYNAVGAGSMLPQAGSAINPVNHPVLMVPDMNLQQLISKAMNDARTASNSRIHRQLLQIELTAKQLQLHIQEYEDIVSAHDAQHGQAANQQAMGDEEGA